MAKQKKAKKKKQEEALEEPAAAEKTVADVAEQAPMPAEETEPAAAEDETGEEAITPERAPDEEREQSPDEQIAAAQEEIASVQDQLLRARADFDNYRKRMLREMDDVRKRAAETLLYDLLSVLDNLERALEHADDETGGFVEGIELVAKQFMDQLAQRGVKPIPAVGEVFNPEVHEAVAHLESEDAPEEVITQEYLKGYTLADKVLRPSKVVVSAGTPATEHDETASEPSKVSDAANTE